MKKVYKHFLAAALAVITFSGCGNEADQPEVSGRKDSPDFAATIGDVQSRAFDRTWEAGDQIGISGLNRTNVCHHTPAGDGNFAVKKYGDQIYFQDDNEATFTAYYPWNDLAGATAVTADTRKQADQKKFDFLWATASGKKDAPDVTFNFAHKMAKITLTVKPGNGMSYEEAKGAKLSIEGCSHTGSFNVSDGSTTVGNVKDVWDFSEFAVFNDADKTFTFSLIIFPQLLDEPLEFMAVLELPENRNHSLRAYLDFTAANSAKDGDNARNEWVAGRQYNLTVTLNKTEITLGQCVINAWNEVIGDDIIVD